MSKQKMMTLSMLAALCVLATLSMHARAQTKESKSGQEGMVVVRDAQTGKMRAPTPQELRELRANNPASSAAVAGTPPQQQPKALSGRHGGHGVRLGEKTLVYDVVTRGEDGKLSSQCVQGEDAAQHALHTEHAQQEEHRHEAR